MIGSTPCVVLSSPKLVQRYIGLQGSIMVDCSQIDLDLFILDGIEALRSSYIVSLGVTALSVSQVRDGGV